MSGNSISPKKFAAITAVLGVLTIFPPLATDMYLAAIGHLADSMQASHAAAELSLSLFFLGLCIGQLILGPVIDIFGRKKPLMIGIVLFVVTSIALVLVDNIAIFNTLRFFQAIGACAGMVVGRAIVSDLYHGREAAKVMNILVMMLTIGPIISPTLGSVLLEALGWHSIFIVMALVGVIASFLTLFIIPETLPLVDRKAVSFHSVRTSFVKILIKRRFMLTAIIAGLVQGGMFAFITGSSGVFQGVFGLSALQYGLMFAGIALALMFFSQINKGLLNHYEPGIILKNGLRLHLMITVILVIISSTKSMWLFVAPLWLAIGMVGLLSANAMSLAMAASRKESGVASALLGAIQFAIAFLVSSCVAMAGTSTTLPMALGLFLPCMLAILLSEAFLKEPVRNRTAAV
ncbi:multidrug effflux MFS transporter [Sneathiella litorea]|uniref:Bcr/CflA family efflux transporter n=1 Tax=Sneathiella litorea TaxID=2606216 RepID=A0A6L8W5R5_9PROT|nr:multidrug effflux MFS transporter [Sneathiella litorea]MZR30421.1 Bcr/CflA family efflux MFS transporter [Sneathiella litorea]